MAEYIEREAAIYRAKSFIANHIDGIVAEHAQLPYETCNATEFARGYERGAIDAVKVVLATPAADVEVVKHGRWYDIMAFNNGERIIATCSNCKDRGELRTDRNEWGIWHINSPRCPNCGCKMDLEVTNGLDQH